MADKTYSVDDILNEYSSGGKDSADDENVNENNDNNVHTDEPDCEDRVTLHNTDIFNKVVTPDLSDIDFDISGNDILKEAENLPKEEKQKAGLNVGTMVAERLDDTEAMEEAAEEKFPEPYFGIPDEKLQDNDRSFSEKYEMGDIYNDEEEEESWFQKIRRKMNESKAERHEETDEYDDDEPVSDVFSVVEKTAPKKKDNPFDKYAAISENVEIADEDIQELPEAQEYTPDVTEPVDDRKSIDEILEEYSAHADRRKNRTEVTQHKSFTDFFTKVIPSERNTNTELLDGMMKMKKERASRTQNVSPIERKSISDIDLNLDNKIIPDTSQLPPIESENSEADKLSELRERRSKKIKDFVLMGDEEDIPDEENEEEEQQEKTIEDFETMEDAPSIAADIAQSKHKLMTRLVIQTVCLVLSLYIAISNYSESVPVLDIFNKNTNTEGFLFANAIIGFVAMFFSYTVISSGISKLLSFKADSDSLCAAANVLSMAACVVMFANTNLVKWNIVHIYTAAAIFALVFNTIGKLLIVSRTQRSFRFISGSSDKYALFVIDDKEKAQDFTRGALKDFPTLASMRKTEFITDFIKTSYSSDSADRFCKLFTNIVAAAALVVAVLAGFTTNSEYGASGFYVGVSAFVGCISLCSVFSIMLVVNLPMERASKKNADFHGAVLGYDAIDEFADTNSVLVDALELFPQGSVSLSAIKIFSDTRVDDAIIEAASLTNQSGSILKHMFYDIIVGKTEMLNPVESYIFEDSMGICGWINNRRVLLGNRELMINHSIEGIPTIEKETEYTRRGRMAVYLSISGELSAMFIVELTPSIEVKQALEGLQKAGVYTIIRTVDSLVTISNIAELFDVSPEYFKLIYFRNHTDFEDMVSYRQKQSATLACSGQFAALASLVLSCKHMKGTILVGIAIEAIAILLGILICLAMVVLKSFSELTVTMVIIYNLIFTAILVLFQLLRKN